MPSDTDTEFNMTRTTVLIHCILHQAGCKEYDSSVDNSYMLLLIDLCAILDFTFLIDQSSIARTGMLCVHKAGSKRGPLTTYWDCTFKVGPIMLALPSRFEPRVLTCP